MKLAAMFFCCALAAQAQGTVSLPEVTIYSPRVANQAPAGTFAMPVSALRYEPAVDVQARNLAEGQADVTIRGGIFETTGFQIGASSLLDPQTGHYLAEIPIAPAMLSAPAILTGAELAERASNANVGAIAYAWRPVRTAGFASVGAGEYGLRRGELYQGYASGEKLAGQKIGFDVAVAHSESDGAVPHGDHDFDRVDGRLQLSSDNSQTDLFAGYQAKFFGWPNLYAAPFNSNESENLETLLFAVNHRQNFGGGDFVEASAYYRRNKDDYAFNRSAPLLSPNHPFQHTSRITGVALGGRSAVEDIVVNYHGELLADELKSTSLTFGPPGSRTLIKLAVVPERTWKGAGGAQTTVKLGATYDSSNHGDDGFSPVFEIARENPAAPVRRLYFSYAETTQVPSYTALKSNPNGGIFRGNPSLGRETSHNVEVGASTELAGWTGQAAIFWRRDGSLVDWTFQPPTVARFANPVDIDTTGFEVVARRAWSRCDLVLGYTALTKDADYRGLAFNASFYALNFAKHRLTAALTVRLGEGFELRIDNVARIQEENPLRVTGGDEAVFTSVGLAYRPQAWKGAEVSLQVDNLWDSDFQEVPGVPAAPRQLAGGVSYKW